MSAKEILVPDIGDFRDVDVIEIHIREGQVLKVDDPMVTLESDKASMDLPAPEAGMVKEVKVKVGDKVSRGSLLFFLESTVAGSSVSHAAIHSPDDSGSSKPLPSTPEIAPVGSASATTPSSRRETGLILSVPSQPAFHVDSIYASPSIRRLAREKNVDLNLVKGTGRKSRITREDVESFAALRDSADARRATTGATAAVAMSGTGIPAIPVVDFSKFGPVKTQELGRIKRLTATAMTRSWLNIPHVTHNDEADITELEAFRKSLKDEADAKGLRISLLSFALKAVVYSLRAFPTFNASLDPSGEQLILKQYYHIGIAVDTPNGLVVPVIRDVEQKSIFQLSQDLVDVSQKARSNKLALSDIQGGTFTISSLGGIGGTTFTPIINAPEVAILGMTRSDMKPVWNGKDFVPRLMQPLSLSYDHRVIDGAEAARFCRHLAGALQDIRRLLL